MKRRTLGKGQLEVSAIGLGCMGMSFGYGPANGFTEAVSRIAIVGERYTGTQAQQTNR